MNLVAQSIAIIKANQAPSGAYLASPTFSQYRHCWLRDGSLIAYSMDRVGEVDSAARFYHWVGATILNHEDRIRRAISAAHRGEQPKAEDVPPTRYSIDGDALDDDWTNFQLDGYGTWLWGLAEHIRVTGETELAAELYPAVRLTCEYLIASWRLPNYDCWEEFGDRVHPATLASISGGLRAAAGLIVMLSDDSNSTHSHLLNTNPLWPAPLSSPEDDGLIWNTVDLIRDFILSHCTTERDADGKVRFAKSTGNPSIDSSLLWISTPFDVVSPDDPVMIATLGEIEKRLYHQGVHRYPEDTYYGGGEWILLTCWLGWHYCRLGRYCDAERILSWVESKASDSGDLPEQVSSCLNDPDYYQPWVDRWGAPASPLLWSHAMYLVLYDELEKRAR